MFEGPDTGRCAHVHEDHRIELPEDAVTHAGGLRWLERVCERDPDAVKGLRGCLDYVNTQIHCRYRDPNLPKHRCGFEDGVCVNLGARR